ncbi:hypothetical protein EPD60_06535 [Flaviaesturariibacter flavus]|uniref:DUF3592 domain-containing protein n=1 Tax=Flaviaesturariibacter flavus TaxID=2502780 RepID=A0A4R1BKI5_9BACT|nr:hypothetical protein [Flaviaesturariibacter flavus]TCJ17836.1 hypothetical protein EPD60_06535 [Flaviaesturariibacter flavus]
MPLIATRIHLLRASIEYGLLLLLLAGGMTYYQGSAYRDRCRMVPGLVFDQVGKTAYNVGGSPFKPLPVFRYIVNGEQLEAVPPNADLPVGARATLLVDPVNLHDIRVYNAGFWVHFGFNTFPIFLFGGILYAVLRVQAYKVEGKMRQMGRGDRQS